MFLFQKKPHFGETRVPIKIKMLIRDIRFESNEYFMPNSTYSVFQNKNKHHKLKSKKSLLTIDELENIEMNETLKFHATLFQKDGKYLPKIRKIVIRQNTSLDEDDVYKDIGYVELPLHKIVEGTHSMNCKLELFDPDHLMKAHINVTIRYKFTKGKKDEDRLDKERSDKAAAAAAAAAAEDQTEDPAGGGRRTLVKSMSAMSEGGWIGGEEEEEDYEKNGERAHAVAELSAADEI